MPTNRNGVWYQAPNALDAAVLKPTYFGAAATTNVDFDFEDARKIKAVLYTNEFYKTGLTGSNNDLVFTAKNPGTTPTVRITYVDPAANSAALSVTVSGSDITVNLATNGSGTITSTAALVKAAIEAKAEAAALITVANAPSNDGTGVVTAMSQQTLGAWAGTSPTVDVTLQCSFNDGISYHDIASFGQKTAIAADEGKLFEGIAKKGRWKIVVGGTNPEVAISIDSVYL